LLSADESLRSMISMVLRSRSSCARSINDPRITERRSSTGVSRDSVAARSSSCMKGRRTRSITAASTSILFLKCQYTAPRV